MKTYQITLKRKLFQSEGNDFAVFHIRQCGVGGGWAAAVFMGEIPVNLAKPLIVIGNWVQHGKYGHQFRVAKWEIREPTRRARKTGRKAQRLDWLDIPPFVPDVSKEKFHAPFNDSLDSI